ncbi:hypothetical protein JCM3765_007353 [Sporobolomyces pararoseus]
MSSISSSAADLTASLRRTFGQRPPPLVGCSVTLLKDSLYVFGGRLVTSRTMVQTLYKLDLITLEWKLLSPSPSPSGGSKEPPQARYFHSCCSWGENKLVIFGGEGYNTTTTTEEQQEGSTPTLETLNDLHIYNVETFEWQDFGEIKLGNGVLEKPLPRYAHLGVICTAWSSSTESDSQNDDEEGKEEGGRREKRSKSCLMIMGGQDLKNTYLHSTDILDLDSMTWLQTGKWERHIGTYRAIATSSNYTVKPSTTNEQSGGLKSLSYTEPNNLNQPEPLLLFSNFNFTQVRRDLDLISSPLTSDPNKRLLPKSLSSRIGGGGGTGGQSSLPPGLRFPSGFQIGNFLIIFGTFLSTNLNNFSIWSLNLGEKGALGLLQDNNDNNQSENGSLEWMRIDPGSVLQKGSWNRAVGGWRNNVIVLGDRERDIAADYDHRQTNFTHVAFIDLEAHGIYQPPPKPLPCIAQSFGLFSLSQPLLSDFEIICSDGKRLACCRKILQDRWSWFNLKILEFRVRASGVVAAQLKRNQDNNNNNNNSSSSMSIENSENGGSNFKSSPLIDRNNYNNNDTRSISQNGTTTTTNYSQSLESSEILLTPRTLSLPEHSLTVLAFLQYLYTLDLTTDLQLSLPILISLLNFSKIYQDPLNLKSLVVHALHETLSKEGTRVAPMIYEAATLGGCTALQIRSLKILMLNTTGGGSRNQLTGGGGSKQQVMKDISQGRAEPMARQASQDVRGSSAQVSSTRTTTTHSASVSVSASTRNSVSSSLSRFDKTSSLSSSSQPPTPPPGPPKSPPPSMNLPSTPTTTTSSARFSISPLSPSSSSSSSLSPVSTTRSWSTRRDSLIGVYFTTPSSSTTTTNSNSNSNESSILQNSSSSSASSSSSSTKLNTKFTRLETQQEEEEGEEEQEVEEVKNKGEGGEEEDLTLLDPHIQSPTSPITTTTTIQRRRRRSQRRGSNNNNNLESSSLEREIEVLDDNNSSSNSSKLNRNENGRKNKFGGLLNHVGGGAVKKEEKKVKEEGVWYPTFLDSVKVQGGEGGGGTISNPLSTRKATLINLEHLTSLETPELGFNNSLLSPSTTSFSNASRSSVSLSLSSSTRQQSQSPSSFPMNRKTSSSSAQSVSSSSTSTQGDSELVTPPMPSITLFDPAVVSDVEESSPFFESSSSPSPRFPKFFASSKKKDSNLPQAPPPLSTDSASAPVSIPTPSSSSSGSSSIITTKNKQTSSTSTSSFISIPKTEAERLLLEIELGTRLLKSSGASEKEIKLRARSVGFQVLKSRETGKDLPSGFS